MRVIRCGSVLVFAVGLGVIGVNRTASGQSIEQTVYVTVLNKAGAPVTDLASRDFIVRENNVEREVLRVSPESVDPMDIAVLVDNSQAADPFIVDIRRGLAEFIRTIGARHAIALIGVGERPTILVDYTHDTKRLEDGANRLFPRTGSGAYLLDGIIEASRGFRKREAARRVLVVITAQGQEFSERYTQEVVAELRNSGSTLAVLRIADTAASRGFDSGGGAAALPDRHAIERDRALAEGAATTGGRQDDLSTSMALPLRLRELASELNHQYRLVYARPPALIPPESVQVTVRRPELRVRATRVPPK